MTGRVVPAHKVVGDVGKPGQVVYPPDITLNDYIKRKTEAPAEVKLTFDDWWDMAGWEDMHPLAPSLAHDAWKAGQANK